MKILNIFIVFIAFFVSCEIVKSHKHFNFPIETIGFNRSKFQVADLLDSIVRKDNRFNTEEGRYEGEILINYKTSEDTITFYFFFYGTKHHWLTDPDTTRLAIVDIGYYIYRNSNSLPVSTDINNADKIIYKQIIDSAIIIPLKELSKKSTPYKITKIVSREKVSQWEICKNILFANCDTIEVSH